MSIKHVLLLSLLGLVLTTVHAQEEKPAEEKAAEGSEKKEEKEEDDEDEDRKLSIKSEEGKVEIESEEKTATEENKYEFVFSVKGFPNLRLSFYNETSTTEAETTFRVGLMKLVEVDENNYETPFNSTKVTKLGGSYKEWGAINFMNETKNGTSVLRFSANKTLADGCYIQWDTYVVSHKTNITSDYRLSPNAVKFSFTVKDYVWKNAGNKLAMVGTSFSRTEVEDEVTDKETVVIGNGQFTWDNWVMSGQKNITLKTMIESGVNKSVVADPEDDEDDEDEKVTLMAWMLDSQATEFFWDPKLSAQPATVSSAGAATISMMVMAVAGLVSLL